MTRIFFQWILSNRLKILVSLGLLTLFCLIESTKVLFTTRPLDIFPKNHPYVKTFSQYEQILGSADYVRIVLAVRRGDVFNIDTLSKVQRITKSLELLDHIHPFQVISLAQKKVKDLTFDGLGSFRRDPLMWPEVPQNQEQLNALKKRALSTPGILGRLVSPDLKAVAIDAGFLTSLKDYKSAYAQLKQIVDKEQDADTEVFMIGRPILIGQILENMPQLLQIFALSLVSIILVLFLYFRSFIGMIIPVVTGILSAIWALALLGISGINFDPLVLVIPFLLSARALSHSVQFMDRFEEEINRLKNKEEALVETCSDLFQPAGLAIIQDAATILILLSIPIPLLQKLSIMSAFWVFSILVINFTLHPALLSYLPVKIDERPAPDKTSALGKIYAGLVKIIMALTQGIGPKAVLAVAGAAILLTVTLSQKLVIGDAYAGSFLLWPDSRYNRDTTSIGERFGATDLMTIVVEAESADSLKDPGALQGLALFQRTLAELASVIATVSIVDLFEAFNHTFHSGDPRWAITPSTRKEGAFLHYLIFNSAEPGDLNALITPDSKTAAIAIYLKDHTAETLQQVVAQSKQFISSHPLTGLRLRLAGGPAGLLSALNETIAAYRLWILAWSLLITFAMATSTYRSILAGLIVTLPMLAVNFWAEALMVLKGIGLNANTLPVVALGVGLGVDYGIYILSRVREEFNKSGNFDEATRIALATTGRAATLTAGTMILSCVFWFWSFLRFQAEMGLLLALWMILSWLAGMVLVPCLAKLFKPWFLRIRHDK